MSSGIYKITSPSGRFYVGSAVDLSHRWRKHKSDLRNGTHHCKPLQNAARKYGVDSFVFEVLTNCSVGDLITFEQAFIDVLKPSYNVAKTAGSLLGFVRDAALRKTHSDAMRRKWQDPNHRAKVSAANTGHVPSTETRAKMSQSAKRRLARDGHPLSKPVICVDTGVTYPSATCAARDLGLSSNAQTKISQVCLGHRPSAYGHKWMFAVQSAAPSIITTGVSHMAQERMTASERLKQIVEVGYNIARKHGIRKVTRAAVARDAGVSDGLINRYVAGREGLRAAVMEHAVTQKDVKTLAAAGEFYELPSMPRVLAAEVKKAAKH